MLVIEALLYKFGYSDFCSVSLENESFFVLYLPSKNENIERFEEFKKELENMGITPPIEKKSLNYSDWSTHWKKFYSPKRIGKHLIICPSWENFDPLPGDHVLIIDPGMAFGTGYHPTTELIIELLEDYLLDNSNIINKDISFLDFGCGSGIIALCAHKMGLRNITAVDFDPLAVDVSLYNCKINNAYDEITVVQGDTLECLNNNFDMIVSNITADIIIEKMSSFNRHLKSGGVCLISGIVENFLPDIEASIGLNGFLKAGCKTCEGWYALLLKKEG